MSFTKIPFILSSALAIHVVMTPPNRPPPSGERVKPTGMEFITPWIPTIAKPVYWSWALLEIAVILAINNPTASLSQHLLHKLIPGDDYTSASRIRITGLFLIGWILSVSGSLVRRSCYRLLGPMFTFELSIRKEHKLVTSGPYAVVRHPSYVGAACAGIGVTLCHLSSGSWVTECLGFGGKGWWMFGWVWIGGGVVAVVGLVMRMEKEDQMLWKEFGKEWEEWRERVPWRIIPGVY